MTLHKLIQSIMLYKTEVLKHSQYPNLRIVVTRSRFERMYKPKEFATSDEIIAYAKNKRDRDLSKTP